MVILMSWIAILFGAVLIMMTINLCRINIKQQATIDKQQDTIKRLLEREPVTYQEVGKEPPKPSREYYSAWSNQIIDASEPE